MFADYRFWVCYQKGIFEQSIDSIVSKELLEMTDKLLEESINETWNIAVYLQLMGAFVPKADFQQLKQIIIDAYDFLKNATEEDLIAKVPQLKLTLQDIANPFIKQFPLKTNINTIATNWNALFKGDNEIFSRGINYGWLEEHMDLKRYNFYKDYIPFHLRIGLVANKGHFGIEEEFLLRDAFNTLSKAERYYEVLLEYGNKLKREAEVSLKKEFGHDTYTQITDIKFEVAAFSRLTIISFYAFIECFINSIGFSYFQRHQHNLEPDERETLQGFRKGRYLQLKAKIERYQIIIRNDKKANIITSDEKQMTEPFTTFFDYYEELRNASVHYSPLKEQIWLKPEDWLEKARNFSKLSIEVGLAFWKACYNFSEGPHYLGKLDYKLHYDLAKKRQLIIERIQYELH